MKSARYRARRRWSWWRLSFTYNPSAWHRLRLRWWWYEEQRGGLTLVWEECWAGGDPLWSVDTEVFTPPRWLHRLCDWLDR